MKTYTKTQAKELRPRSWSAMTSKGSIQVKASLKENALTRLRELDSSISIEDVHATNAYASHQASCDRLIEIDALNELYTIEYDAH